MLVSVKDENILNINTCALSDDGKKIQSGVIFEVKESEIPYEIIFTRKELEYMIKCIDANEIY